MMSAHPIHDTTVLTGRSLTHVWRSLDTTVMTAVPPIAFLSLFPYVFGGAIDTGSTPPYVDHLLPGLLLIAVASAVVGVALPMGSRSGAGVVAWLAAVRFGSAPGHQLEARPRIAAARRVASHHGRHCRAPDPCATFCVVTTREVVRWSRT